MNTQRMINRIGNVGSAAAVRLLVVLAMTTTTFGAAWDDQTAEKLESVTGGRVKVVWQQITDLERYGFVRGGQGGADGRRIMAFDSKERRTRVLVSGPAPVCGAWILDDGEGVVYTHLGERSVNYIRWEGTGQRTLFTGEYCYVLSPWTDPDSGHTWIYVGNHFINAQERPAGFEKEPTPRGDRVYRVRLDDPTVRELVWDRTQVDLNFRVAGDGRMAGAGFPWPRQGLVSMPGGQERILGRGCNSSIAPDTSYRYLYMEGNHRFICLFNFGDTVPKRINVQVPDNQGMESWLPRWTNRTPFFTIAGPIGWQGDARKRAEIWLAQFDRDFTRIQNWVQITNTPDTWVTGGHAWVETSARAADPAGLPPAVRQRVNQLLAKPAFGAELRQIAGQAEAEADAAQKDELGRVLAFFNQWTEGAIASAMDLARRNPERARESLRALATQLDGHPLAESVAEVLKRIPGAWPSEGVPPVFAWANARTHVRMPGQQAIFLRPFGNARFDQFAANLESGWMRAPGSGPVLQAAMREAKGFTLEAYIQPDRRYQSGMAVVLGSLNSAGESNVAVIEDDDRLFLQLRTAGGDLRLASLGIIPGTWAWGGALVHKTPRYRYGPEPEILHAFHLAVTYDGTSLHTYLNGAPTGRVRTEPVERPFANWGAYDMALGAAGDGSHPWQGLLEGVAVHARALSAEEVKAASQNYLAMKAQYPVAPRYRVRATLKEKAARPDSATTAPYYQAMSVYHYEVQEVLAGAMEEKDIYVATWYMRDTKLLPSSDRNVGAAYILEMEAFDAHPHLEPEFITDLDRDLEANTWLEITAETAEDVQ